MPAPHRLRLSADFRSVMRSGVRAGRATCVVHALAHEPSPSRVQGPRVGLVVSKAVGNSVFRHRMSRRLRHICRELVVADLWDVDIVVRALPASVDADAETLRRDVLGASSTAVRRARERRDGVGKVT